MSYQGICRHPSAVLLVNAARFPRRRLPNLAFGASMSPLLVGDAELRELRRLVRPIGKATGRNIDLTLLGDEEFRRLLAEGSSFVRQLTDGPVTTLVGDLGSIAA